jgi:hypothetical protein
MKYINKFTKQILINPRVSFIASQITSLWILASNVWDDNGVWDDADTWND